MSRVVRQLTGFLVGLVAALAVLIGSVGVGVWLTGRQTADVPMPPRDARPDQVVRAYLRALDAHDCATAVALRSSRGGSRQLGRLWCRDVQHLRHVQVDHRYSGTSRGAGVRVSFDLSWRPFHDDGSMEEGPTLWGYDLDRDSTTSPWRITDEGEG